jgi:tRNA(Ile)-lysidine synthase
VLTLQPRNGGERLKPNPARPSRTLKNLFQESALPAQQRPWLPLAYLNGQLAFAAGLGMDARVADAPGGVTMHWRGEGSG